MVLTLLRFQIQELAFTSNIKEAFHVVMKFKPCFYHTTMGQLTKWEILSLARSQACLIHLGSCQSQNIHTRIMEAKYELGIQRC